MNMRSMAREERTEFAEFLASLSREQWDAPTLCTGWRVRDVVAHVIGYDALGMRGTLSRLSRNGFNVDRLNAVVLAEFTERSPEELVTLVRRHRDPRGLTAGFGCMIALVDGLIHQQDIRRPLGLPREIPAPRLRRVLQCAKLALPIGVFKRARGLRLVASDVGWSSGRGLEVRGPGEALLLAASGRPSAIEELSGPGVGLLTARVGG